MLQDHRDLIVWLLGFVLLLSLLLTVVVAWFKVRRDRLERSSARFREHLLASWQANDFDEMLAMDRVVARGSIHRQTDLVAVCHQAEDAQWWSDATLANLTRAAGESGLTRLLRRQLRDAHAARRGLAVVLGGFPPTQLDPRDIVHRSRDKDATVRMSAVASLERIGTPDAARALIAALCVRALPSPRLIERLGHPWAVPSMLRALDTLDQTVESDEQVRCDLLRALSLAADPRAIAQALTIAENGTAEEQIQAMRVLESTVRNVDQSTRDAIEDVAVRLAADPHPNVRGLAVPILRNVEDRRGLDCLTRMTSDPDWFVRKGAARALASLGDQGVQVLQRLADGPDRFAAERAREELTLVEAGLHHAEVST